MDFEGVEDRREVTWRRVRSQKGAGGGAVETEEEDTRTVKLHVDDGSNDRAHSTRRKLRGIA